MKFWDHQAESLKIAREQGGLLGDLSLGAGKTLISMQLPFSFPKARRVVLLMPPALIQKSQVEFCELLAAGWKWPGHCEVRLVGYNYLSLRKGKDFFEDYRPDLIIADEGDALANLTAATKRLFRYIEGGGKVKCCLLSATFFELKWEALARVLCLVFGSKSPLPIVPSEVRAWDNAFRKRELWRLPMDILMHGTSELDVRKHLVGRVLAHPGVISTVASRGDAELRFHSVHLPKPTCHEAMREVLETERAPGNPNIELFPADIARHMGTLAWGFYRKYSPEPPQSWLSARSMWNRFVLEAKATGKWDTDAQVEDAVKAQELDSFGIYETWRSQTYVEGHEAVWLSQNVIESLPDPTPRTLYWTRWQALGERVAEHFGIPYFHKGAEDALEQKNGPCVVSIDSHGTGRNLQFKWSENHVLTIPGSLKIAEQMCGRTMRPRQTAKVVNVYWYGGWDPRGARGKLSALRWEAAKLAASKNVDLLLTRGMM